MSTLKTCYQWVTPNNKQDFKIGKIYGGVADYTPKDTFDSRTFSVLNSFTQPAIGDKVYLCNSGGDNYYTMFGKNSLDIGTPLINCCTNPVIVGVDEDTFAWSIYKTPPTTSDGTDWLTIKQGNITYVVDTGVAEHYYTQGNVTYIMLITDDNASRIRVLSYVSHIVDYALHGGSGSYGYASAYVFGGYLGSTNATRLLQFCYDTDRAKQSHIGTGELYLPTTSGNFKIQKMGTGSRTLGDGTTYDYNTSYGWTASDTESFAVENDGGLVIRTIANVGEDAYNNYWAKYHNYTYDTEGWTLGTNLLMGTDENNKYTNGLGKIGDLKPLQTYNYNFNGWRIECSNYYARIRFYIGSTMTQEVTLYNVLSGWPGTFKNFTLGAFICRVNNVYKLYIVGVTSAYKLIAFTVELNTDIRSKIITTVQEDTSYEYQTPPEETIDNEIKERRGVDENGTYVETYNPDTETWTKTYDKDRDNSGERGSGDGTSDPYEDDEEIDAPESDTTLKTNGGFYTVFSPTTAELRSFVSDLHDSTVLNAIKEYFTTNPMDGIMGMSMLPYFQTTTASAHPKIGTWTSTNSMAYSTADVIVFNYGNLDLKECFGNFLDYSGTQISIFLPHIGYKEIDPQLVMGTTIKLRYNIFKATGDILAYLYSGTHLVYQWQGNCALQIPVTHADYSTCVSSAINALSTATSLPTTDKKGNVTGVDTKTGLNVVNGIANMNRPSLQSSGNVSGASGFYSTREAHLLISRANLPISDDKGYAHSYGKPSCEYGQIRCLKGFTMFDEIDISGVPATEEEKNELHRLLTSEGIYV